MVKWLDEATSIRILVLCRTKVQEQDFAKLVRHRLRFLIARTRYQMVWRILSTPMLTNVLMWIRGSTMCSTTTLTQCVPTLYPSKPAPCSLQPPPPPLLMPAPAPLGDDFNYVESGVMGLKRLTVTRPLRCRKMILKWDTAHGVGIKLLVSFVVMGQRWIKFFPASGCCDFMVLFAVLVNFE